MLIGIRGNIGARNQSGQPFIFTQKETATFPISGSQCQFQKFVMVLP